MYGGYLFFFNSLYCTITRYYSEFDCFAESKKREILMANLPSGVIERDLEMFSKSQEAAHKFLERENAGLLAVDHHHVTTHKTGGADHGVPSQVCGPYKWV